MISYQQAVDIMLRVVASPPPAKLPLETCAGLTLAESPDPALAAGAIIAPARLAYAASIGLAELVVHPRTRVELSGESSLIAALGAAIQGCGCEVRSSPAGQPPDVWPGLRVFVGRQLPQGVETLFDGVGVEPGGQVALGRPQSVAAGGPGWLLRLPADPAGAIVAWLLFGGVLARRLMGWHRPAPHPILAMSSGELPPAGDQMRLIPGVLTPDDKWSGWHVRPISSSDGTASIAGLAAGNSLIVRPPNAGRLAARAVCDVLPLETVWPGPM